MTETKENSILRKIDSLADELTDTKEKESIHKQLAEYHGRPLDFVKEVLGVNLWSKQEEALLSVFEHDETAFKSSNGVGKSFIAAIIAITYLYLNENSIVITTAPTNRQVKEILFREIISILENAKQKNLVYGKVLTQEIKVSANWKILGFTASEYSVDKFQGFRGAKTLIIVDESSGISNKIFEQIDSMLTGQDTSLFMIGNPLDPLGRFAVSFKPTSNTNKISINTYETPNFTKFGITEKDMINNTWQQKIMSDLPYSGLCTPKWVAKQIINYGIESQWYKCRVLGQFPSSSPDSLVRYEWIEKAIANTKEKDHTCIEIGVDVARYGNDYTVIYLRHGSRVRLIEKYQGKSTMETVGIVISVMKKYNVQLAKIDDAGLGGGCTDRLLEQGINAIGVNVGTKASNTEEYANLRAELYDGLRQRFEKGDIDIEESDAQLIEELMNTKKKMTSRGQIAIEKKEDMKKRGLKSPDHADALMLCFAVIEPETEFYAY